MSFLIHLNLQDFFTFNYSHEHDNNSYGQQYMNKTTKRIGSNKSKQPQNDENNSDSPQHMRKIKIKTHDNILIFYFHLSIITLIFIGIPSASLIFSNLFTFGYF